MRALHTLEIPLPNKLLTGKHGLGTGGDPEKGRRSATESI
jgi:cell division GTPase FtsZ